MLLLLLLHAPKQQLITLVSNLPSCPFMQEVRFVSISMYPYRFRQLSINKLANAFCIRPHWVARFLGKTNLALIEHVLAQLEHVTTWCLKAAEHIIARCQNEVRQISPFPSLSFSLLRSFGASKPHRRNRAKAVAVSLWQWWQSRQSTLPFIH